MRPLIVLFGSSIVQYSYYEGWGATLSHAYARKADVVLRGYAGWNSIRGVEHLKDIFPENSTTQPALVIVYFGGNDATNPDPSGLGPHVEIENYKANMKFIANYLIKLSDKTRIIFLSVPPVDEEKLESNFDSSGKIKKTNENCRRYSEACLEVCSELNIKAIDLWSAIQKTTDWKDVCFQKDGIHLSAVGSEIVSKEILNVIRTAEWEPSLHWPSMPTEFGEDSRYDPVLPDGRTINISNFPYPTDAEIARKIII